MEDSAFQQANQPKLMTDLNLKNHQQAQIIKILMEKCLIPRTFMKIFDKTQ
jgi:hypothetical protein